MRMRFSDRWSAVPGVSLLEMESGMGRAVFLIFFCSAGQGGEGKRVDKFLDSMVAHQ
jgi:hypothetical protein